MKKVLSLVLVLTLVLGSFSFAFAAASDVVGTDYEAAVERLSQLGVLTGYPDGTFKPNNTITRAEFAAAVVRVKGLESAALAAQGSSVFTDVPAGNWAAGYVNIASKLGIVKGMGDGTFAPAAPVTYEQAVTMVMRALNYEATAEARGGYPYGYLIVANENDLLDKVKGVQGLPAPRGLVAQLLDNALEIPMMIQVGVGFNSQPLWAKSGTQGTEVVTLLDELGFKNVKGVVAVVNEAKASIKVGDTTLTAPAGFDFNFYEGLTVKAWYASGKIVAFTQLNEAKYDAVAAGEKLTLVGENKKYVVADKATLVLNGKEVKATEFAADYAKVILNADNEIVWAQGFTWNDFMLVEKVKDDVVYSYGEELDIDGYTIVEDGKTSTVEAGDVLFFNDAEGYAVVYNNSKSGEIDRIYTLSFRFASTVYEYELDNYDVKYFDGSVVDKVTQDILKAMADEGDVEVFFDYSGNAVLVMGDTGEEEVDYFYGVVTADTVAFEETSRNIKSVYFTFDVLNSEGKVVKYDITSSFANKYDGTEEEVANLSKDVAESNAAFEKWRTDIKANVGVKVTVNTEGVVKKVEVLEPKNVIDLKLDAKYASGYRLQDNAVVFLVTGEYKDAKTFAWADAKDYMSKAAEATVYVGDNGRIVAMLVTEIPEATTTTHVGLVTNVRTLRTGVKEVTIEIAGKEFVYLTANKDVEVKDDVVETIVEIKLYTDDTIKVVNPAANVAEGLKVDTVSTARGTITVTGDVYKEIELVENAVIYNSKDFSVLKLRDLGNGDTIDVYFIDDATARFVNYVVATLTPADGDNGNNEVTGATILHVNGDNIVLKLEDNTEKSLQLNANLIVKDSTQDPAVYDTELASGQVIKYQLGQVDNSVIYIEILK